MSLYQPPDITQDAFVICDNASCNKLMCLYKKRAAEHVIVHDNTSMDCALVFCSPSCRNTWMRDNGYMPL